MEKVIKKKRARTLKIMFQRIMIRNDQLSMMTMKDQPAPILFFPMKMMDGMWILLLKELKPQVIIILNVKEKSILDQETS